MQAALVFKARGVLRHLFTSQKKRLHGGAVVIMWLCEVGGEADVETIYG